MKYFTSIWILLLLLSSCSVKKITQQYLDNDDVCFCGLDSLRLINEKQYDLSTLNFDKLKKAFAIDTIINNEYILITCRGQKEGSFTIWEYDKTNNIKTIKDYCSNGKISNRRSILKATEGGVVHIGYFASLNKNGKYEWESNENYIKSTDFNKSDTIAQKYPICWKEALNIVETKIGKYELLRLYRDVEKEPNTQGMQYYWTVKTKKRWRKPKYYFVDAVTGRVERAIIIATVGWDDML